MFSYYGTKRQLAPFYPPPQFDVIIEPFAGAAAYSCMYPNHTVRLYDVDPIVVATWKYLIASSRKDILNLPDLPIGSRVDTLDVPIGARFLMGFEANPGSAQPKITASARSKWAQRRIAISDKVEGIKHWEVFLAPWSDIPNQEATWFVDPPYQLAGKWYRHNSNTINFKSLGLFCRRCTGQTIVCENEGAKWLPFQQFKILQGSRKSSSEVVWINSNSRSDDGKK